jgi:hypothetical protein
MFRLLEHILLGQKELLNNWQIGFSIDILPPCTLQSVQHSPKLALVDQLKQECHAIDSHGAVVRPSSGRSTIFLFAHYHDGTVSVPDDGVRDAPHQRPPDTAKASASHDDQAGPDLLTQMDYLPVGAASDQVGLSHAYPLFLDLLYLLVEEGLGLLHGFLELMFEHLTWARRYGVREGPLYGCGEHVCYVQLRVGALGHIRSGGEGQLCFT